MQIFAGVRESGDMGPQTREGW